LSETLGSVSHGENFRGRAISGLTPLERFKQLAQSFRPRRLFSLMNFQFSILHLLDASPILRDGRLQFTEAFSKRACFRQDWLRHAESIGME
jgi:hypothetical protein